MLSQAKKVFVYDGRHFESKVLFDQNLAEGKIQAKAKPELRITTYRLQVEPLDQF